MARKRSMLARVDPDVWADCRRIMPKASSPAISRMLYDTSLLKYESILRKKDEELDTKLKGIFSGKRKKPII